jgi:hypothetical protein
MASLYVTLGPGYTDPAPARAHPATASPRRSPPHHPVTASDVASMSAGGGRGESSSFAGPPRGGAGRGWARG